MTYNVKTAIRVVRESDIPQVIPFFEAIKRDCYTNCALKFVLSDIKIGSIWGIFNNDILARLYEYELPDYTIIEGIPENWREEMETPKNIHREIADQYQDLFNLLSKEHGLILTISEMDNIVIEAARISESKINQLESENKELIEQLNKSGNNLIEECGKTAKLRDKNLALKQSIKELEDFVRKFEYLTSNYLDKKKVAPKEGTTWGDTGLDAFAAQVGFNDAIEMYSELRNQAKQLLNK